MPPGMVSGMDAITSEFSAYQSFSPGIGRLAKLHEGPDSTEKTQAKEIFASAVPCSEAVNGLRNFFPID